MRDLIKSRHGRSNLRNKELELTKFLVLPEGPQGISAQLCYTGPVFGLRVAHSHLGYTYHVLVPLMEEVFFSQAWHTLPNFYKKKSSNGSKISNHYRFKRDLI